VLRVELIRQLKRGRTWGLIAALTVVPIFIAIANYVNGGGGRPSRQKNIFTLLTSNGLNFSVFILLAMSNFFLVVVVAAFAGESVAGEATWGTLRYLLVRPVRRPKLIAAKIAVAAFLALLSTLLIVVAAFAVGTLLFGSGELLTVPATRFQLPGVLSFGDALGRLALATGYVTICMFVVVAVGMFLSTLTDSTAAAVVGTIVIIATCPVLLQVPSLEGIRPVVPTQYWAEWNRLFYVSNDPELWKGLVSSAVYTTLFSALAFARFQRKDITS
jgi:ABC-2 type transport system permease protein